MDYFHYRNRELFCEDVPVATLAAQYGTPLWIYSKRTLLHHLTQIQQAFAAVDPVICYSVKANSNLGILKVMQAAGSSFDVVSGGEPTDVVGPVCESSDYFAKDRYLPPMHRGDLVCTFSAGAYGMAMSSNYNSRPKAVEILVDGSTHHVIRKRETYADLVAHELT